jgi:hypothetical protein
LSQRTMRVARHDRIHHSKKTERHFRAVGLGKALMLKLRTKPTLANGASVKKIAEA